MERVVCLFIFIIRKKKKKTIQFLFIVLFLILSGRLGRDRNLLNRQTPLYLPRFPHSSN